MDLLINRLHDQLQEKNRGLVDLMSWYNFATFDIIADLTFGEPFYCLRDSDYHPYVRMVFANVRATNMKRAMTYLPVLGMFPNFVRKEATQTRAQFLGFVKEKVNNRLSSEAIRPDFMTYATKYQDEKGLTEGELHVNASLFLVAGSETTATMLSGTTYWLLRMPEKMRALTKEIRDHFGGMDEMTIDAVTGLPYLNAVINEGLRMCAPQKLRASTESTNTNRYPPVPVGFPRKVPAGGDTVSGYYLPEDVSPRPFPDLDICQALTRAQDVRVCLAVRDEPFGTQLCRARHLCAGALARRCTLRCRQENGDAAVLLWPAELPWQEVRCVQFLTPILS